MTVRRAKAEVKSGMHKNETVRMYHGEAYIACKSMRYVRCLTLFAVQPHGHIGVFLP